MSRSLRSLLSLISVWKPSADSDDFADAQSVIQAGRLADLGPTADLLGICMSLI